MEAMLRDPELQQRADANPSSRQKWRGAKNSTAVYTRLGFPAFGAVLAIFWLMITRPTISLPLST
jgi:uncharacterized membrane protein